LYSGERYRSGGRNNTGMRTGAPQQQPEWPGVPRIAVRFSWGFVPQLPSIKGLFARRDELQLGWYSHMSNRAAGIPGNYARVDRSTLNWSGRSARIGMVYRDQGSPSAPADEHFPPRIRMRFLMRNVACRDLRKDEARVRWRPALLAPSTTWILIPSLVPMRIIDRRQPLKGFCA